MSKRKINRLIVSIIVTFLIIVINTFTGGELEIPSQETTEVTPSQYEGTVTKVVDGDTIKVNIDNVEETIRLIGINTPETVHPSKPVECFGKEASDKAKEILTNQNIVIETDPSQSTRDRYGRMLGYVFLTDGTNVNKNLINEGYAYEYTYDLPYKYQTDFKDAQEQAVINKRGLWNPEVCNGTKFVPSN